jgi:hypothetical protein
MAIMEMKRAILNQSLDKCEQGCPHAANCLYFNFKFLVKMNGLEASPSKKITRLKT